MPIFYGLWMKSATDVPRTSRNRCSTCRYFKCCQKAFRRSGVPCGHLQKTTELHLCYLYIFLRKFPSYRVSGLFDNTVKPGVYFRFVDDTFAIFGSELDCDHFKGKLNLLHPALKFTVEKEQNNSLNFLDVLMEKDGTEFLTSVYRNQPLLVNTSVGIPLAQRQERLALSKP